MAQQEHHLLTLLPLPKMEHIFDNSVHFKPDLAHTHVLPTSISPDTQKLTHSPGRQGNTHMTNS